jgi:hypothetical protein
MRHLLNTTIDSEGHEYRLYVKYSPCDSPKDYFEIAFESEYDGTNSKQPQTKWKTTLPLEALNTLQKTVLKNG